MVGGGDAGLQTRAPYFLAELVEDPAGHEVAEGGGEVGGGAVAGVAFDTGGDFCGALGGGGTVTGWELGLLGGEDGGNFKFAGFFFGFGEVVFGTESSADREEEGVAVGFGEIIEPDLGGVGAATGSSAGDDGDVFFAAGGEEVALLADGVDGIDDDVGMGGEEVFRVFRGVEGLLDGAAGLGIDEVDSPGQCDGLGLADGLGGGVDLPVGVGEAEIIEIDEGELPDAGTGEGFDGPRADSAEANDHDVALGEFFERGDSVKSGNTSESVEKVLGHGGILCPRCRLNKREDSVNHPPRYDDDQRRCEEAAGLCPSIFGDVTEPGGGVFVVVESAEPSGDRGDWVECAGFAGCDGGAFDRE